MKFERFMEMYDDKNGIIKVDNDNLGIIVIGNALEIMGCLPMLDGVKNYDQLFEMEVVSFGFYDDELCVRVK